MEGQEFDQATGTVAREWKFEVEKYDVIRALFRDGRLVQGRLWSGIERSGGTSGGLVRRSS